MSANRSEAAVQRIEAALARIARVADAPPADGKAVSVLALVEKHETLRETVAQAIADIDAVVAEIDQ